MDQIESTTYKLLKSRINEMLKLNINLNSSTDSYTRVTKKESAKKRQVKAKVKLNARRLNNTSFEQRQSIAIEEEDDDSKHFNSPDSNQNELYSKPQNNADVLIRDLKKSLNHVVTRSQIKLGKRKPKNLR